MQIYNGKRWKFYNVNLRLGTDGFLVMQMFIMGIDGYIIMQNCEDGLYKGLIVSCFLLLFKLAHIQLNNPWAGAMGRHVPPNAAPSPGDLDQWVCSAKTAELIEMPFGA